MNLPYPQERGILYIGKQQLKSNTTIVSVPSASLMSIKQTEDDSTAAGKFFILFRNNCTFKMNEDEPLAVYLLFEKHLKERSRFYSHIQLIPTSYDLPFNWTDEEIESCRGAGLHVIATRMKEQVKEEFLRLESCVNRAGTAWNFSSKTSFTFDNYVWAMCTIWSRGITLKMGDKVVKAIAPFFDMFNHDPNAKTRHHYDSSRGYLSITTTGPLIPGYQVCLNYGAYSSTDSVRLRGFLTPGNPNESYTIQTQCSLDREDYEKRLKLLRIAPPEKYDVSRMNGGVNHSESGVLMVSKEYGVVGNFDLFEDKYNEALHRSVVIEKCKSDNLDSLGEQIKKDKVTNVDIELELDVLNYLGEALAGLRDGLAPNSDEKVHLLDITSDMEQGKTVMKEFTVRMQKEIGYVPGPHDDDVYSTTNGKGNHDEEDDDWGISLKLKASNTKQNKSNAKGRKGTDKSTGVPLSSSSSSTTSTTETSISTVTDELTTAMTLSSGTASSTTVSSSPVAQPIIKFSDAANDSHIRRLQMINYIRNVERRILQSHLEKIADAKHTIRTIVLGEE